MYACRFMKRFVVLADATLHEMFYRVYRVLQSKTSYEVKLHMKNFYFPVVVTEPVLTFVPAVLCLCVCLWDVLKVTYTVSEEHLIWPPYGAPASLCLTDRKLLHFHTVTSIRFSAQQADTQRPVIIAQRFTNCSEAAAVCS